MGELFKAGTEVYKTMETLIANNVSLTSLALVDDEILIVFKDKAGKTGDHVIVGKTSKAAALLSVLGEGSYKFVITLAQDEWVQMSTKDQEALLFHHLSACGVEENTETGNMKCYVKIPDVNFFREEVEKYGFWRTSGETPEANLIDDLFGTLPNKAP